MPKQLPRELVMIGAAFVLLLLIFVFLLRNSGTPLQPAPSPAAEGDVTAAAPNRQRAQNATSAALNTTTTHIVQRGETLAQIAARYSLPLTTLITANSLTDPNHLLVGQSLIIPDAGPARLLQTPAVNLIPDSELVYSPSAKDFDIADFVDADSYLYNVRDDVEGRSLSGVEVVQLVADRTRVNPRLLLAVLEYRAGWVTQSSATNGTTPLETVRALPGLYRQLEWAANQLNLGYYGRGEGGLTGFQLGDGAAVSFAAAINDGSAGVYNWLGAHTGSDSATWQQEVSAGGFIATYRRLFGDPFAGETTFWPPNAQPQMSLPWPADETWYLTGGPHGGWASGSGWAALDFVPPDERVGCYDTDRWVTAVADGVIVRSDFGAVVLDLDGDGYAGSGWAILYQHVAARERVQVGERVRQGDPIGHPSCEGGYSTGTHLHLARMYNGRWVSADNQYPFELGGWVSQGAGSEYNGALVRAGERKTATVGRLPQNAITAD